MTITVEPVTIDTSNPDTGVNINDYIFKATEIKIPDSELDCCGFGTQLKNALISAYEDKYNMPVEHNLSLKGVWVMKDLPPHSSIVGMPAFTPDDIQKFNEVRDAATKALGALIVRRSPRAIARYFLEERIYGTRKDPMDCPGANFLSRLTGYDLAVHGNTVGYPYDYVAKTGAAPLEQTVLPKLSVHLLDVHPTVRRFIANFDAGRYPEIDKEERAKL